MFVILLALLLGVSVVHVENADTVKDFRKYVNKGYTWQWVGKQPPPKNVKYIGNWDGDKEVIYFQLKKKTK